VAVARSLLTNAPVLVLDEAKSNLDAERELTPALAKELEQRTALANAHRLSIIGNAQRIAVLRGGAGRRARHARGAARRGRRVRAALPARVPGLTASSSLLPELRSYSQSVQWPAHPWDGWIAVDHATAWGVRETMEERIAAGEGRRPDTHLILQHHSNGGGPIRRVP
jgi:energy-coupling factor transporter ATP-binding protein EcfA2